MPSLRGPNTGTFGMAQQRRHTANMVSMVMGE
jgi:hypothetical protein